MSYEIGFPAMNQIGFSMLTTSSYTITRVNGSSNPIGFAPQNVNL